MILEFLADGFEEIEALTPVDVLRRAGLDVKTAAVGGHGLVVRGSHGIPVTADMTAEDAAALGGIDMVILPGGMPGAKNLDTDPTVDAVLGRVHAEGGILAAICAAPMVLGHRGYLMGKRATCFPGFEGELAGADYTAGRVEEDGRIVTACGMGAATEFALALVRILKGGDAAEKLRSAILAK
ncbi:MAG: DJ-1/PfpI family protein [Clostridia bacterium]|nr:DJ-1/PfpI family protein [Clostridia bacterium]MBR5365844.1 DJ-1/PfpI family protein [Clostridia bacterium]